LIVWRHRELAEPVVVLYRLRRGPAVSRFVRGEVCQDFVEGFTTIPTTINRVTERLDELLEQQPQLRRSIEGQLVLGREPRMAELERGLADALFEYVL
jgi:hypothetical protein